MQDVCRKMDGWGRMENRGDLVDPYDPKFMVLEPFVFSNTTSRPSVIICAFGVPWTGFETYNMDKVKENANKLFSAGLGKVCDTGGG